MTYTTRTMEMMIKETRMMVRILSAFVSCFGKVIAMESLNRSSGRVFCHL